MTWKKSSYEENGIFKSTAMMMEAQRWMGREKEGMNVEQGDKRDKGLE